MLRPSRSKRLLTPSSTEGEGERSGGAAHQQAATPAAAVAARTDEHRLRVEHDGVDGQDCSPRVVSGIAEQSVYFSRPTSWANGPRGQRCVAAETLRHTRRSGASAFLRTPPLSQTPGPPLRASSAARRAAKDQQSEALTTAAWGF